MPVILKYSAFLYFFCVVETASRPFPLYIGESNLAETLARLQTTLCQNAEPPVTAAADAPHATFGTLAHRVPASAVVTAFHHQVGGAYGPRRTGQAHAPQGAQTATGVEANQQRTIQFVKDCRDRAEKMLDDLLYAIAGFAVAKQEITRGDYKATFNFGDITYNEDEDRARWLTYVSMGKIPFWYYLKKFEGMTEEEAKKLEEEAKPQLPDMFGGEGQPTGGQTAGAQKPRIPQEE